MTECCALQTWLLNAKYNDEFALNCDLSTAQHLQSVTPDWRAAHRTASGVVFCKSVNSVVFSLSCFLTRAENDKEAKYRADPRSNNHTASEIQ